MKKPFAKPMKTRYSPLRPDVNRPPAKGQLFLGHKVLGELRILIRLAAQSQSNGKTEPNHSY